tara:strand:+ start:923 stop:3364 length:2442 start_codon:yes stop_codon:yes gene_type:complete
MKIRIFFLGIGLFFTFVTHAQMTGVVMEVDTAFYGPNTPTPDDTFDPDGNLNGYVTYKVYAEFTNTTDVLSAIYADVGALGTPLMYIDAPCGCHNPVSGSVAMDGTNPSAFWIGPFADYQYDTYWTIGMPSSDAPGIIPQTLGLPSGNEVCSAQTTNGSVFLPGGPINAIAGDDYRVLIAQVTTCNDWCMNASFQVFIEGDQTENQFFSLPDEVCFEDPCKVYIEEEATVTGNILPCAGGESSIEVEFIGEGAMTLAEFNLYDDNDNLIVGPQDNTTFNNLGSGNYVMHVVDEFYCRDTVYFEVIEPNPIVAEFELTTDNNCFGQGDATVCISDGGPLGGTGALTLAAYDPTGTQITSYTNDSGFECWTDLVCIDEESGFTFSVFDTEGCVYDTIINVNCPLPITDSLSVTQIDCNGNANGSIYGEAQGGSGDIYLHVNANSLLAPNVFNSLAPGTYTVELIDDFGCSNGPQIIEIIEPSGLNLDILSAAPISCGSDCNGSVTLSYAGGTGELDLQIIDILLTDTIATLDSLCASDYSVTVIDANGCEITELFTINAPTPLEFLISPTNTTCTGMCDGSVDIFPAGGTAPLDLVGVWEGPVLPDNLNSNTSVDLNNLCDTTYIALVTDALGCVLTDTFSIGVDIVTDMVITTFTSPVTCWGEADGTITASVFGSHGPFTFQWSDPASQTTSTANNLTADSYSVVVTDTIGCKTTVIEQVDFIDGCMFIADAVTPNNDQINDKWIVGIDGYFPEFQAKVYNRYGQLLFTSEPGNQSIEWDPKFNGKNLPIADYYYVILLSPDAVPITGTVTVKY